MAWSITSPHYDRSECRNVCQLYIILVHLYLQILLIATSIPTRH